jgi:hypothetical protein
MNAGQLDAFVSSVSGVLSKPALEALSTPQEVFSLGAYEPAEHSRAAAAEMQAPPEMMAKAAAALPPSVNHISMMQPV